MNTLLTYESLAELQDEVVNLAWENGWHVEPVYKYSSDGKLQGITFEVNAVVSHKSPPKGYPSTKEKYADPANYKYPIDTEKHVRAAWSYINMPKNQKGYSPSQIAAIKGRIKSAGKKFGIDFND